ncbi:MAG: hypothetical protein ACXAC7_20885, partial [Candidatus Hodarchaeales archaeon]
EGKKLLDLDLAIDIIEEDFEFEVFSKLTNIGKTVIEDIKVALKVPGGGIAKIISGSSEKTIFTLTPGDEFQFSNTIHFEAGILGKKYPVKLIASFEGEDPVEKEILLVG